MRAVKAIFGSIFLALAWPAHAQYFGGGMDTYGLWEPQSCAISSGSQIERDSCYDDEETDSADLPIWTPPPPTIDIPPVDFGFEPSLAIRQSVYDRILNAQLQDQIKRENNGQSIIQQWGQQLRPYNLKTDNLADAMTVWALNAHGIMTNDFSTPGPQTTNAVRAQFAFGLIQSGNLATASDADKQRMADQLWVYSYGYAQGALARSREPAAFKAAKEAAAKHAQQLGIDFAQLTLTASDGFRPKANSVENSQTSEDATNSATNSGSYGSRKNKMLEEFLANMKRQGRQPDPAIVALIKEEVDEVE